MSFSELPSLSFPHLTSAACGMVSERTAKPESTDTQSNTAKKRFRDSQRVHFCALSINADPATPPPSPEHGSRSANAQGNRALFPPSRAKEE